jgi:hypothetical protein
VEGSRASFWVAVFRALYGDFTGMDYPEFKINILELLFRQSEIHQDNPDQIWFEENLVVPTLISLSIRKTPPTAVAPLGIHTTSTQEVVPVTKEKYRRLWEYEMDDKNEPSPVSLYLMCNTFL